MDLGEHDLIFMVDSEVTSGATLSAAETSIHLEFGIPFKNFAGRFALTYGLNMAISKYCDTWTVPLLAFPSVPKLLRTGITARGRTWEEAFHDGCEELATKQPYYKVRVGAFLGGEDFGGELVFQALEDSPKLYGLFKGLFKAGKTLDDVRDFTIRLDEFEEPDRDAGDEPGLYVQVIGLFGEEANRRWREKVREALGSGKGNKMVEMEKVEIKDGISVYIKIGCTRKMDQRMRQVRGGARNASLLDAMSYEYNEVVRELPEDACWSNTKPVFTLTSLSLTSDSWRECLEELSLSSKKDLVKNMEQVVTR